MLKDDPILVAKDRDRWYGPDPNKAGDLEKLCETALFKVAWQECDYAVFVTVADKIPNNVLKEDPELPMWYDQAVTRMGGE